MEADSEGPHSAPVLGTGMSLTVAEEQGAQPLAGALLGDSDSPGGAPFSCCGALCSVVFNRGPGGDSDPNLNEAPGPGQGGSC